MSVRHSTCRIEEVPRSRYFACVDFLMSEFCRENQLLQAFGKFDEDKRGSLTFLQVRKLLMSFGLRPGEQQLDSHMKRDELAGFDRVSQILEFLLPMSISRARLLKALSLEDSRQETPIDGLLNADSIKDTLIRWGLSPEEIEDSFGPYQTKDGRLDYVQLVNEIFMD